MFEWYGQEEKSFCEIFCRYEKKEDVMALFGDMKICHFTCLCIGFHKNFSGFLVRMGGGDTLSKAYTTDLFLSLQFPDEKQINHVI